MVNFLKKIIESLYWKYCAEDLLKEEEVASEEEDFEIVFEPDPELEDLLGSDVAANFECELFRLFAPDLYPKTELERLLGAYEEEEQAMIEKKYNTVH